MNENELFLQLIHKNATMGVTSIPTALTLSRNQAMTHTLQQQLQTYRQIAAQSQQYAKEHAHTLTKPSSAVLLMTSLTMRMQSLINASPSKLAEHLIQGSTMGTVQMTRSLNHYAQHIDPHLAALGQTLLRSEEQHIQDLKQFL